MPRSIVSKYQRKLAGELRRSQILTSYGSGALVDFPRLSGIMAGLESWPIQQLPESAKIRERNLEIMLGKDFFIRCLLLKMILIKLFLCLHIDILRGTIALNVIGWIVTTKLQRPHPTTQVNTTVV